MTQKSSVLAGIFVGIGGFAYLSLSCKELGAALFALGLLAVILQKYSLYTGKVGYAVQIKEIPILIFMCLRNFVGAAAVGILASMTIFDSASTVISAKLANPLYLTFISAFLCGILIYIAVELFAKERHPLFVIMPIMIFILCGFEHCVANAFYFAAAREISFECIIFMLVCTAGNAIGSLSIRILEKYKI